MVRACEGSSAPACADWSKVKILLRGHNVLPNQPDVARQADAGSTIVETIAATTSRTGLKVECAIDQRTYEKGINVSEEAMAALAITDVPSPTMTSIRNGTTLSGHARSPTKRSIYFGAVRP